MPIKDFRKGLEKSLHGAVNTVREKVKDIDTAELKENLQNAADVVKDKAVETGGKLAEVGAKTTEQVKELFQKKELPEAEQNLVVIPTKSALKIIYYLMAADGEIFHGEEEKFDEIGKELDSDFEQSKDALVSECKAILDSATTDEAYVNALHSGIDNALDISCGTEDGFITPRLLIWDLLTVAYSDESCNEVEQDFIDHVAERLGIGKAILLEMQSSILTMLDLEKELAWIKTTDRPYLSVEAHVKEIEKRKAAIMESVMSLISL